MVKDSLPETLLHALEVVSQGGYFLEGPVSAETVQRLKGLTVPGSSNGLSRCESLTRRQKEVMHLLVRGLLYKAIGAELHIIPRTVEGHRNQIMQVFELENTVELTRYAVRSGIIEAGRRNG